MYNKLLEVKKKCEQTDYPYNLTENKNIIFTKKEITLYAKKNNTCLPEELTGGCIVFL
jgi:hypothetical protein